MAQRTCEALGCPRRHLARGYCHLHYERWRRNGTIDLPVPLLRLRPRRPAADLFWEKVDQAGSGAASELGPCWIWTAALTPKGYGVFSSGSSTTQAHRWAWTEANGPIQVGLVLDHLCHNVDPTCPGGFACLHRRCVRPDHLEPVATGVNSRRSRRRGPLVTLVVRRDLPARLSAAAAIGDLVAVRLLCDEFERSLDT